MGACLHCRTWVSHQSVNGKEKLRPRCLTALALEQSKSCWITAGWGNPSVWGIACLGLSVTPRQSELVAAQRFPEGAPRAVLTDADVSACLSVGSLPTQVSSPWHSFILVFWGENSQLLFCTQSMPGEQPLSVEAPEIPQKFARGLLGKTRAQGGDCEAGQPAPVPSPASPYFQAGALKIQGAPASPGGSRQSAASRPHSWRFHAGDLQEGPGN